MAPLAPPADALEITCRNCGAKLVLEPHLRTAECPYCASTSVVERPTDQGIIDPSFVLPFSVARARAQELCKRWIRSRGPFTRPEFKRAAPERARGLYVPAWLYGAAAHTDYTCEIGEDYQETYTTTDSKGNTVTRTRTVTEWRRLAGRHATWVQDVLVTASRGLANDRLEAVEPFDLRALQRYSPALLSGFIAEEPSLGEAECRAQARLEAAASIERSLEGFLPGDHRRGLACRTELAEETLALVLLPVWVFAVRSVEGEEPVQVLVNGRTGEVAGRAPRSWVRIVVFVLLVLAAVALVTLAVLAVFGGVSLFALAR